MTSIRSDVDMTSVWLPPPVNVGTVNESVDPTRTVERGMRVRVFYTVEPADSSDPINRVPPMFGEWYDLRDMVKRGLEATGGGSILAVEKVGAVDSEQIGDTFRVLRYYVDVRALSSFRISDVFPMPMWALSLPGGDVVTMRFIPELMVIAGQGDPLPGDPSGFFGNIQNALDDSVQTAANATTKAAEAVGSTAGAVGEGFFSTLSPQSRILFFLVVIALGAVVFFKISDTVGV